MRTDPLTPVNRVGRALRRINVRWGVRRSVPTYQSIELHIENRAERVHVTIALCTNASLEPFDEVYDGMLSRVIEVLSSGEAEGRSP